MAFIIKNNKSATNTLNTLNKNSKAMAKSLQKVSSGMKINSAADDASGYAISERMRVQIRSLDQANANAQNGKSLLQVAGGAVESTISILRTMKEKAINAANDTNTDADRATIQKELDQSIDQLDDNAEATFNSKRLFDGANDVSTGVKETIIKALNSEWVASSLQLIKDTYGLSFNDDTAMVKEIDVQFPHTGGNDLANIAPIYAGADTTKLTLNVNMDFYKDLNERDVNGSTNAAGGIWLDRTIAHEFVHALMATNIKDVSKLPLYIMEGAAEAVHGIDDVRGNTIKNMTAGNFSSIFASGGAPRTQEPYTAGYVFMRYLEAKGGGSPDALKRFMSVLTKKGGTALDEAVDAATRGRFKSTKEATDAFVAEMTAAASPMDFYEKSCNINFNNADTGAATGSDASMGDKKDAVDVVIEGLSTSFWYYPTNDSSKIDGVTLKWGDFSRPDAGFRFQIGTKANQILNAAFSDIHARALGLKSDDGKTLSVATRQKATVALTVLDRAIEKTLDQSTTIGALSSRLSYTSDNLTTNSENTQSAESTIRDADMAKEMTSYTKNNVLLQAAQSMLAQANQNSSSVLSLLQ